MSLISKLVAVADAVRAATGEEAALTLGAMPDLIASIEDGTDDGDEQSWTALADQTISGALESDTLVTVYHYEFSECTGVTSVSFPCATYVNTRGFYGCTGLASVSLPSVTEMKDYVFYNCTSLSSVYMPALIKSGNYPFYCCSALSSVSLPAATSLGDRPFYGCSALSDVSLPVLASLGDYAFSKCDSLVSISLPAVEAIDSSAFYQDTVLETVDLGAATSLGGQVFRYDSALTTLILRGAAVCTNSNTNNLANTPIVDGTGYIYVPEDLMEDYLADDIWATYADQFRAIEDYPDVCGES